MSRSPVKSMAASSTAVPPWLAGGNPVLQLAQHHGLTLDERELRWLGAQPPDTLLSALHALRVLGFRVQVLGGEYSELSELRPPFLALTRTEGPKAIFGVGEEGLTGLDPRSGAAVAIPRDRFEAEWTGEVLSAEPVATEAVAARLQRSRRLSHRLLGPLGLSPVTARGLLSAVGGLLAVGLTLLSGDALATGLAGCFALALNAAAVGCARCDRAGALVGGLPVAYPGAALYGGLLGAQLLGAPAWALAAGVGAALGVHLTLLLLLLRAQIPCARCGLIGGAALLTATLGLPAAPLIGGFCVLFSAGLSVAFFGLARRLRALRIDAATLQVTREILAREPAPEAGTLSLTVLSRLDCPTCSFFEAAVLPGLEATWGERLRVEVREAGDALVSTPFLVLRGANAAVMPGLDVERGYERLERALQALADAPEPEGTLTVLSPTP